MKKPTTISKESVSEYREFVQLRLRKRVLRRSDTVLGEEPLDGVASEFMSEVLECASQARISPRRVLLRHAHNELTDVLRRRRSAWTPVLAAIVLGCDEVAVPTQKRSGCGNGRNLGQRLTAQSLGLRFACQGGNHPTCQ